VKDMYVTVCREKDAIEENVKDECRIANGKQKEEVCRQYKNIADAIQKHSRRHSNVTQSNLTISNHQGSVQNVNTLK
jgi:uncharacterized protein YktB (UPF0637 family)